MWLRSWCCCLFMKISESEAHMRLMMVRLCASLLRALQQVTDLHLYSHRSDYDPGSSPTKLLPFWAGMFVEHLGINHNPKAYRKKHLLQLLCTSCWAPNLRNPQLVHALSTDSLLADSSKQWTPCGQRLLKEDKRLLGKNFWSANVPC